MSESIEIELIRCDIAEENGQDAALRRKWLADLSQIVPRFGPGRKSRYGDAAEYLRRDENPRE